MLKIGARRAAGSLAAVGVIALCLWQTVAQHRDALEPDLLVLCLLAICAIALLPFTLGRAAIALLIVLVGGQGRWTFAGAAAALAMGGGTLFGHPETGADRQGAARMAGSVQPQTAFASVEDILAAPQAAPSLRESVIAMIDLRLALYWLILGGLAGLLSQRRECGSRRSRLCPAGSML